MLTMRFKVVFFNTLAVHEALDPVSRHALGHAGASIRKKAQWSIRTRKRISDPGKPPHAHGGPLRRLIYYAWDPVTETVVVGPLPFKAGNAPQLLEFGGTTTGWRRLDSGRKARLTRMVYRPRPFMGPALVAVEPLMPSFFAKSAHRFGE